MVAAQLKLRPFKAVLDAGYLKLRPFKSLFIAQQKRKNSKS